MKTRPLVIKLTTGIAAATVAVAVGVRVPDDVSAAIKECADTTPIW